MGRNENMVRPKSSVSKTMPPYIVSAQKMYRGQIDSLVKRMIPFADQIQLTHLKLQQVTAKMIPDGVYMDIDGFSSINLGNGAAYTPQEALNLYFRQVLLLVDLSLKKENLIMAKFLFRSLRLLGQTLRYLLVNMYNYNLGMIRSVTGLNEARDGSSPDPNALVGVQKMAALNSNTATRHILRSGIYMLERLAESVSYRMSDVLEYSPMKEDFART